ncbi:MAG: DUF5721 family protein [Defluviitaleaceae bacterium]|nr:DUF5721 family protein [Defluviitaleaceae bacterium]
MLALEIEKTQTKGFMSRLLKENLFDSLDVRTVEIATAPRITLDANAEWAKTRPLVYEIIKLCPKPTQIKIIFSHPNAEEIHPNAAALFLNLVYENDGVTLTTATAQKEFILDKAMNPLWDSFIRQFFQTAGIAVTDRLLADTL